MSMYGIFENQPAHLLSNVLERTSFSDLGSLARVSATWFKIVHEHVKLEKTQKDAIKSQQFFEMGKLIGTVSKADDFILMESFLEKAWKKEKKLEHVGDVIRGFCLGSPETLKQRVPKMFNLACSYVNNLDDMVAKALEALVIDIDDMLEEENRELLDNMTKRRMELRCQFHSLFLANRSSANYGFFLLEIINKVRQLVEDDIGKIVILLRILLNPIIVNDEDEFINMPFAESVNTEDPESMNILKSIAKAFRDLQKVEKSPEEERFCSLIFREYTKYGALNQKSALLAQEPHLISWYIQDHSYLVIMGSKVSLLLIHMTMTMNRKKSEKLKELKEALKVVKNRSLQEPNGYHHLTVFYRRIQMARGSSPMFKNVFVDSLECLIE